jgi:hypothetical protein
MPSTCFNSLSAELIEQIAYCLEPTDLSSFRLVCHRFNDTTWRCFCRTCFSTIWTNLTRKSLEKLEWIAENEDFRGLVQTVEIRSVGNIGQGHSEPLEVPAVRRLRDLVLNKFVDCRSLAVDGEWASNPQFRPPFIDALSIAFAFIVDTQRPLKSFCIKNINLGDDVVNRLPSLLSQKAEFRAIWVNLKELILGPEIEVINIDWLADLTICASGLEKLVLDRSYCWIEVKWFCDRLSSAQTLPKLQVLKLSGVDFPLSTIWKFLGRLQGSLRSLSFNNCMIPEEGVPWNELLEALRFEPFTLESIEVIGLYQTSQTSQFKIYAITFSGLPHHLARPGKQGLKLRINRDYDDEGNYVVNGASYSGPQMDRALDLLNMTMISDMPF